MKQLVYGGILMITGMLGVIAAILALSASIADNASIMFPLLRRHYFICDYGLSRLL
ncbi:MAG: hypothetical protein ACLSDM_06250 [Butyricicoccus sp.]